jgi:UDP-N-acetylmuramyl pentapeptide phosphotransferase/UDP-N-acetylglucosamine-1-phosphate transferase
MTAKTAPNANDPTSPGLDGLAIMPTILIAGALAIFAYIGSNYHFSEYLNMPFMPNKNLSRVSIKP